MALQNSGTIKASDINIELGRSASAQLSFGGSEARELAGVGSGPISLSDFYGKSDILEITYTNTQDRTAANIYELMGSPSEPGIFTFENDAVISAGSSSYALRTGAFPTGSTLIIVNRGKIQGRAGNGGSDHSAGTPGGNALHLDCPCSVDNSVGLIFGGGGGGGGSRTYYDSSWGLWCPGGGGAGLSPGVKGSGFRYGTYSGGFANSRARAPQSGTSTSGGLGGRARVYNTANGRYYEAEGGAGGGPGISGGSGVIRDGGLSSVKGNQATFAGGSAGKAINLNGYSVDITAGNTPDRIKGAIS